MILCVLGGVLLTDAAGLERWSVYCCRCAITSSELVGATAAVSVDNTSVRDYWKGWIMSWHELVKNPPLPGWPLTSVRQLRTHTHRCAILTKQGLLFIFKEFLLWFDWERWTFPRAEMIINHVDVDFKQNWGKKNHPIAHAHLSRSRPVCC